MANLSDVLNLRLGPELRARLDEEATKRGQTASDLARDLLAVELVPVGEYVKVSTAKRRAKVEAYRAELARLEAEEAELVGKITGSALAGVDKVVRLLLAELKARVATVQELSDLVPRVQVAEELSKPERIEA